MAPTAAWPQQVDLPRELLYDDDLAVIAKTNLIKRLYKWKDKVESRGMRVNTNKTEVMISGECQKVMRKARWVLWSRCW